MFIWSIAAAAPCSSPTSHEPPTSLQDVNWCTRDYPVVAGRLVDGMCKVREYTRRAMGNGTHRTTTTSLVDVQPFEDRALVLLVTETFDPYGTPQHSAIGTLLLFAWRRGGPASIASATVPPVNDIESAADGWAVRGRIGRTLARAVEARVP